MKLDIINSSVSGQHLKKIFASENMYGGLNDSASQYTEVTKKIDLNAVATRYNEDPVTTNNI